MLQLLEAVKHDISIHAPREGGDRPPCLKLLHIFISIHAPREGGDAARKYPFATRIFQSTPPARGATSTL